jgi:hypothetical protein
MKILFLTFYYEPDLCAGSFRNTALSKILLNKIASSDKIEVITTMPNRYHSFKNEANTSELNKNIEIFRIELPTHKSGFFDQIKAFFIFFQRTLHLTKGKDYDIIYASSSRLFTAFLGAIIARSLNKPLYLDIRDIFVDTLQDVIKSRIIKFLLLPWLKIIEKYTIQRASHLNLVSKGFQSYFSYFKGPTTFFPNGIDNAFLTDEFQNELTFVNNREIKIITYAGNIGEGQGLEKIIPLVAKRIGNGFLFRVIGDGGTRYKLESEIKKLDVENVELIPPVSRQKLMSYYIESDYLFLHLNDYEAFKKVLPSKIFEYAATNKTIIAGVGGYSRDFIEENICDIITFDPGDVENCSIQLLNHSSTGERRVEFVQTYTRENIMNLMSDSILKQLK